jgi:hypothetical protein
MEENLEERLILVSHQEVEVVLEEAVLWQM